MQSPTRPGNHTHARTHRQARNIYYFSTTRMFRARASVLRCMYCLSCFNSQMRRRLFPERDLFLYWRSKVLAVGWEVNGFEAWKSWDRVGANWIRQKSIRIQFMLQMFTPLPWQSRININYVFKLKQNLFNYCSTHNNCFIRVCQWMCPLYRL